MINEILDDIGHATHLPFSVIAARVLLAAVVGAAIGFEREWQDHPAGLRTHILISIAAALIAMLAIEIMHSPQFESDNARFDPIRLVEAVTAGVAFLAAGLIIFDRGRVLGLTTGAGMWLAASLGLAAGLGFWQIAGLGAAVGVAVLWLIHWIENMLIGRRIKKDHAPD